MRPNELSRSRSGEHPEEVEALFGLVYDELRVMARRLMSRELPGHTLQPTALVNDAYLRLANGQEFSFEDRAHFLAIAARAMRQVLVAHAKARSAKKRSPSGRRLCLDLSHADTESRLELLALDDAIAKLRGLKMRTADVVELRYFGGLSITETASALKISERSVSDDWTFARAWLQRELS